MEHPLHGFHVVGDHEVESMKQLGWVVWIPRPKVKLEDHVIPDTPDTPDTTDTHAEEKKDDYRPAVFIAPEPAWLGRKMGTSKRK
jgi:hypothetical protein